MRFAQQLKDFTELPPIRAHIIAVSVHFGWPARQQHRKEPQTDFNYIQAKNFAWQRNNSLKPNWASGQLGS